MKIIASILILSGSFFGISDTYDKTQAQIENAIEERDFLTVKVLLNDLLPIIKEDIKEDKKALNENKQNQELANDLSIALDKKNEIYHKLHHLLKVSPAAVRVQSGEIVKLLNEYKTL